MRLETQTKVKFAALCLSCIQIWEDELCFHMQELMVRWTHSIFPLVTVGEIYAAYNPIDLLFVTSDTRKGNSAVGSDHLAVVKV